MNLVDKIGQMLVYGWKGDQPRESQAINHHARALIDEFHVGGIIVMGRNVGTSTAEEVMALTEEFQAMAQATDLPPLLVATDQEGGRVCRFVPPNFRAYPTPWVQGQSGDPYVARMTARGIGNEMSSVGVNWVLAPVLDVNNNPSNPIIGDRSFGADAAVVSAMGVAAITGYQEDAGVMACGKHFPGHGDTDVDSHLALPRISHDMDRLLTVELAPFQAAIDAGIGSIMTTHILFDAFDKDLPATLSPAVLTGLLRKRMNYDGLVVTDCLEMKGVSQKWGTAEAAVLAAIAGADQILVCHTLETQRKVIDALVDAVTDGRLSEDRVTKQIEGLPAQSESGFRECKMQFFRTIFSSVAILAAVFGSACADAPSIQVDAAANVQAVLSQELVPMFIKQTGADVNVNYGATGQLEKQVENGGPCDVFISADDSTVGKMIAGGFLAPGSDERYAVGQLVVVLRPGLEGRQASMEALGQTWVTKVAIADPKVAPYGKAAVDAMEKAGVYETIVAQERLTIQANVQAAYDASRTLNADAAITALSLVIKVPKANYSIVPQRYYSPLSQSLGVSTTASPIAKQFAEFLVSAPAQAVFKRYGYLPPKPHKNK